MLVLRFEDPGMPVLLCLPLALHRLQHVARRRDAPDLVTVTQVRFCGTNLIEVFSSATGATAGPALTLKTTSKAPSPITTRRELKTPEF
jgi:hypothetical protein